MNFSLPLGMEKFLLEYEQPKHPAKLEVCCKVRSFPSMDDGLRKRNVDTFVTNRREARNVSSTTNKFGKAPSFFSLLQNKQIPGA